MSISDFLAPMAIVLAYLIGSIPFARIVGKLHHVDPTKKGSKNPGASNIGRLLGLKWGILTLCLDLLKGYASLWLIQSWILNSSPNPQSSQTWLMLSGLFAILGHCYPFSQWQVGGKGVATALGVILFFMPQIAIIGAIVWLFAWLIFNQAGYASLAMSFCWVLLSRHSDVDHFHFSTWAIFSIIAYRHTVHLKSIWHKFFKPKSKSSRKG